MASTADNTPLREDTPQAADAALEVESGALALVAPFLPLDARARAACVSPTWRDVLLAPQLWSALDLSAGPGGLPSMPLPLHVPGCFISGEGSCVVADDLLRGAAAHAGGGLKSLDLSDSWRERHSFSTYAVLDIARENAASLREIHLAGSAYMKRSASGRSHAEPEVVCYRELSDVRKLLEAAPLLEVLHADIEFAVSTPDADVAPSAALAQLAAALRREPPFAPLRVRRLRVADSSAECMEALASLLLDIPAELVHLELAMCSLDTLTSCEALAGALLDLRIPSLVLHECVLQGVSAAPLARVIRGGALAHLAVQGRDVEGFASMQLMAVMAQLMQNLGIATLSPLFELPGSDEVMEALRECKALRTLKLCACVSSSARFAALLDALRGHETLAELTVEVPPEAMCADGAAALGLLVAADAPALRALRIGSYMDDEALEPLTTALPSNSHLEELGLKACKFESAAWVRDSLIPGIAACAPLRELNADYDDSGFYSAFYDPGPDEDAIRALLDDARRSVKTRSGKCSCPYRVWSSIDQFGGCFRTWEGCWAGNGPCRSRSGASAKSNGNKGGADHDTSGEAEATPQMAS